MDQPTDTRSIEAALIAERDHLSQVRANMATLLQGLSDVISELRINIVAMEGELDLYLSSIPAGSRQLIRETLKDSGACVSSARELTVKLRHLAG